MTYTITPAIHLQQVLNDTGLYVAINNMSSEQISELIESLKAVLKFAIEEQQTREQ